MKTAHPSLPPWASALLLLLAILLCGTCSTWRYRECKKVGHGTAYCLYILGEKR